MFSVVLVPKKETCEMAAEKNFSLVGNPNLLAWLSVLALKRTQGCPMTPGRTLSVCPCVAESETFLHGEGERVTARAMVSQVRQRGFKFYYYYYLLLV